MTDNNFNVDGDIHYNTKHHIIFTTKYGRAVLSEPMQLDLFSFIGQAIDTIDCSIEKLLVKENYVYMLMSVSPKVGVHKALGQIKNATAHTMKVAYPELKSKLPNLWTKSYLVSDTEPHFSVILDYILLQKAKK